MASIINRMLGKVGRLLQPLLNPDREWTQDRLDSILKEQRRDLSMVVGQLERQEKAIDRLHRDLEQMKTKSSSDLSATRKVMLGLSTRVRRKLGFAERVLKRATGDTPSWHDERLLDRLQRIARSGQPVLVGPWTGEVGFELTYWIPFLRWATTQFGIDEGRVIACSRGGTAAWYAGIASRYVDVFDVATPEEFRAQTLVKPKQRTLSTLDRAIVRRVRPKLGAGPVALIHPAMMYRVLMPFWKQEAPLSRVLSYARYAPLRPHTAPELRNLPSRYVAVRFYFSNCFPDTPDNRAFAARAVRTLSQEMDVVVLDPGFQIDDHRDAGLPVSSRIHRLDATLTPARNLDVQSAIISGAAAFVGTYGGYSYLAPFLGVPAVAFYSTRNFYLHHLHVVQHALEEANGATLNVVDVSSAPIVSLAAGGVADAPVAG